MSDDPRPAPSPTPVAAGAPDTKGRQRSQAAAAMTPAAATAPVAVAPGAAGPDATARPKVRFDSSNIKSSYCNVCNATSTREEVVINFGVNKTWDQGVPEMEVQLEHRIILSPFAAKRLQDLLVRLIAEHEQRYGKLN
jgi:hypothetical protein